MDLNIMNILCILLKILLINIQKKEDKTLFFNYPISRFVYYILFQDILVDKLTVQDIQIEVELLAYHRNNHNIILFNSDLQILKKEGIQTIMPLMNSSILQFI